MAAIFAHFFVHKMPKIQNFQNRYTRFVKHHTREVHAKFQVPSMYGVQMNGTEVLFLELSENGVKDFSRTVITHEFRFSKMYNSVQEQNFLIQFFCIMLSLMRSSEIV